MRANSFSVGQTYYFLDHIAFPPNEKFTVERVESDHIVVQSSLPRWRDNPMIVTDTSLAVYGESGAQYTIKFIEEKRMAA